MPELPITRRPPLHIAAAGLLLILLWELSGADLWLMQQLGSVHGFALREQWWPRVLLH